MTWAPWNRKSRCVCGGRGPGGPAAVAVAAWAVWALLAVCGAGGRRGQAAEGGAQILWLGGDVYLGDGRLHLQDGQDGAWLAPTLQAELGRGAGAGRCAGIINLEGPLCDVAARPAPGPGVAGERGDAALRLCQGAAVPRLLAAAGVRVAGTANNHALDAGPAGGARTAAALRAAGVAVAGTSGAAVLAPPGGTRVAVSAHDLSGGLPAGLAAELRAAAASAEVLVATFHVTGPPSYLPSPLLRQAVELALRSGALVVAAHGSHVIGPVERRGAAIVAWGLGNLAFACDCTRETEALLLRVTLRRRAGALQARGEVLPIAAGREGPARLAEDPGALYDLLEALGSAPLRRQGPRASF